LILQWIEDQAVIELFQTGERDPAQLKDLTIKAIEDIKS
jgi:hypothetical protein